MTIVDAEVETDSEPTADADTETAEQSDEQSDEQRDDVDVFGFERSQGSSLRSIITDARGESETDADSDVELDDAEDAAA